MRPAKLTPTTRAITGAIDHFSFRLPDIRKIMRTIDSFVNVVEIMNGICATVLHFFASRAFFPRYTECLPPPDFTYLMMNAVLTTAATFYSQNMHKESCGLPTVLKRIV